MCYFRNQSLLKKFNELKKGCHLVSLFLLYSVQCQKLFSVDNLEIVI